jgi:hypothetical protein
MGIIAYGFRNPIHKSNPTATTHKRNRASLTAYDYILSAVSNHYNKLTVTLAYDEQKQVTRIIGNDPTRV